MTPRTLCDALGVPDEHTARRLLALLTVAPPDGPAQAGDLYEAA